MTSRIHVLFILLMTFPGLAKSQDTIYMLSGEEIAGKITVVAPAYVEYITDSSQAVNSKIATGNIHKIVYENGDVEIYQIEKKTLTDQIFLKDGRIERGNVLEIGISDISYLVLENNDSLIYITSIDEVEKIVFRNGSTEFFESQSLEISNIELDIVGLEHGKQYYKAKGTIIGTTVTTALFPLLGLVYGAVASGWPPNENLYESPNPELFENPTYKAGYKRGAVKQKLKGYLTGLGIGTVIFFSWNGYLFLL